MTVVCNLVRSGTDLILLLILFLLLFLPRDALVHSAVLRLHVVRLSVRPSVRLSVRLSVTLVDQDHIGRKSWKLIARSIRTTPLLLVKSLRVIQSWFKSNHDLDLPIIGCEYSRLLVFRTNTLKVSSNQLQQSMLAWECCLTTVRKPSVTSRCVSAAWLLLLLWQLRQLENLLDGLMIWCYITYP